MSLPPCGICPAGHVVVWEDIVQHFVPREVRDEARSSIRTRPATSSTSRSACRCSRDDLMILVGVLRQASSAVQKAKTRCLTITRGHRGLRLSKSLGARQRERLLHTRR